MLRLLSYEKFFFCIFPPLPKLNFKKSLDVFGYHEKGCEYGFEGYKERKRAREI